MPIPIGDMREDMYLKDFFPEATIKKVRWVVRKLKIKLLKR